MNTFKTLSSAMLAIALFSLPLSAQYDKRTRTVNMASYLSRYGTDRDKSPAVVQALNDCRRLGAKRLVFPKGTYYFRPDSLKVQLYANGEAAQGLYGDIQANGLGALMGVVMQQVPELGSLMGQMGQAS